MKPKGGFLKANFSLLHNEKYATCFRKYSTHFLSSTITRSHFSWVGMKNTHTGWMVKCYFRVPSSAIYQLQRRGSLLLNSMKRFSGPLPSLYLSKYCMQILYSDMKQNQIGNLPKVGDTTRSLKIPISFQHSPSLSFMFTVYMPLTSSLPPTPSFPFVPWVHLPRPVAVAASQSIKFLSNS